MANEEQLRKLKEKGVDAWNYWRKDNPDVEIDLNEANLTRANLGGAYLESASLKDANLTRANLEGAYLEVAYLEGANLTLANLTRANLEGAYLESANLEGAYLEVAYLEGANLTLANLTLANLKDADLVGANLEGAYLESANLTRANLEGAYLVGANLEGADLEGANLTRANLEDANLKGAYFEGTDLTGLNLSYKDLSSMNLSKAILTRLQALGTNFRNATFTGVCIEDWNINSETNLDNVICDYIYLKEDQQERRPADPNRNFNPGDFAKLVESSIETVDLIFKEGIDWRAFLLSLKELQDEYGEENVGVQAIERKSGGAFVVRIEVPPEANKAKIETQVKQSYETKLKVLEAQYRAELQAKDREINIYKQQSADMMEIVKLQASRPINPINVEATAVSGERNINTGGGEYRETTLHDDSRYVETRDSSTYYENYSQSQQTLAEAADEIQKLLQQLEQTNPTATVEQQQAYVDIAMPKTLKERLISALRAMSDTAIEEFLKRPGVKVVASGVKAWILPE